MSSGAVEQLNFERVETFHGAKGRPDLFLVPEMGPQRSIEIQPNQMLDTDSVPELYAVRLKKTETADAILDQRRQLIREGRAEEVPLPVHILATAKRLVELERELGVDSPEYQELFAGFVLDCERLYSETLRTLTWEHFGTSKQKLEPITNRYFAYGLPNLDIVERGLSPLADPENVDRRRHDFVVEHINHAIPHLRAIGRLGLKQTVRMRTIAECTDGAIKAYEVDKKAVQDGYVAAIRKIMVWDYFYKESGDREHEQVGVSGLFFPHDLVMEVIAEQGGIRLGEKLTKTDLYGKQFMAQDTPLDFIRQLDQKASARYHKNIFMGEEVPTDHPKDYTAIIEEATRRREALAPKPQQLAEYMITLERSDVDNTTAEALVTGHVKKVLLAVVKQNPELGKVIFDEATAQGYAEAARLDVLGFSERARLLEKQVEENAPEPLFCGANSCGLEKVLPMSLVATIARKLGLHGELLHDTVRSCPECGEMQVVYDEDGNKACVGCEYCEVDGVIRESSKEKVAKIQNDKPLRKLADVISIARARRRKQALLQAS